MSTGRRWLMAGNWKMHHGPEAARVYFEEFMRLCPSHPARELLFFPPAVSLVAAAQGCDRRDDIDVGVQNLHWETHGAFTGETSAGMAREAGASWALVGHSERRQLFGESDDEARRKVEAAARDGLHVMLCVGESLDERRAGEAEGVVRRQLQAALGGGKPGVRLAIAYEPVWAIGTGETATPDDAAEMHRAIDAELARLMGEASSIPVLYGGSVKPANARELMERPEIDGVLVGGASLAAGDFAAICTAIP
jgi:triosephosphate isomerase (TIM)